MNRLQTKLFSVLAAVLFMLPPIAGAQFYEIKHDTVDAYGWFGGDDRPTQGPRNAGVGQSVLVDKDMTVEKFSFYFRGPFDYSAAPTGLGHAVTLTLNVRDTSGAILKTLHVDVPDTFSTGWVTWHGIGVEVSVNTTLIFTTYLAGGYDVLQVKASQGADKNATYPGGQRYGKDGASDADMEDWTDWSVHPWWDSAFKLEGTLNTPTHASEKAGLQPAKFELYQNYPNPFNPATKIRFRTSERAIVKLEVFTIRGQRVATLVNEILSAGSHSVSFYAENLPAGFYLYKLQVGGQIIVKKMILLK